MRMIYRRECLALTHLVYGQISTSVSGPVLPRSPVGVGEDTGEEFVEDDPEGVDVGLEAEGVVRGDLDDLRGHPQYRTWT